MSKAYRFTQTIPACITNGIGRAPVASSSTSLALLTNSLVRSQPAADGVPEWTMARGLIRQPTPAAY
jgi:hypothetical protein